jgi:ribokinase
MTNRGDEVSHDALVLTHALEKLRARDGLTRSRLENSRSVEAAPLLNLASVRRYAAVHNVEPAEAAIKVIAECVQENLPGTQWVVADAVLALGIFSDTYRDYGIQENAVKVLKDGLLGRRRDALLSQWRALHKALGLGEVGPPSDRALRGTVEREVLRQLAQQLVRREEYSFGSKSVVTPVVAENQHQTSPAPESRRGKVVVVGGAVMDARFRTKTIPQIQTSNEALTFDLRPGGKGFYQAVAAARLGLEVALVAAVADDRFGHEIVDHLRDQDVDTSLLKSVHDAHTPFTGIIELEMGDSAALYWRNEREVRLDVRDIDQLAQHFAGCDAVLVTFEIPREAMERTVELVSILDAPRPLVIVTPGQPYADAAVSGQALSKIDYLVANGWELGRYAPPDRVAFDVDAAARQLLAYGVDTLCVVDRGCNVYSQALGTFTVPTLASNYLESSTARDAFCAALAAKLIDRGRQFDGDVALWAAAAMSAAIADHPLPNPMPDRRRVDQLLERAQFTLTPRGTLISGAPGVDSEAEPPQFPL